MTKLFEDLIRPQEEELRYYTKFQILTEERLPFNYIINKEGYGLADSEHSSTINIAETEGYIKIIEDKIPDGLGRFNGGPEPILNGNLKFVEPCEGRRGLAGENLDMQEFGRWKCMRCGNISESPIVPGRPMMKPFECFNDDCGRKGPFLPRFPMDLIKPIWKLPLAPIEATSIEVYTGIYKSIKKYLVLKEDEYHILVLWIMASWLVDDFQTCPYLCMIGPKSSGKSQVINVLRELAYRAVATVSVTPAALFRSVELWKVTLLVDEAEMQVKQETESGQALYGCLNGGYKRGSYAIRIEGEAASRTPTTYEVFGFKAVASTQLFHPTLESRSIVINMSQGMPQKILIDEKEMAILRAKLLFWRFEHISKLPLIFPESHIGRLIEMFIPLFTTAQVLRDTIGIVLPIKYEDLVKLLYDKIEEMEELRLSEEQGSSEAQIIRAINELSSHKSNEGLEDRRVVSTKEIAEHLKWIDEHTTQKDATKIYVKIGRKLKIFGIKTKHTNKGNIIDLDNFEVVENLKQLNIRYLEVKDKTDS